MARVTRNLIQVGRMGDGAGQQKHREDGLKEAGGGAVAAATLEDDDTGGDRRQVGGWRRRHSITVTFSEHIHARPQHAGHLEHAGSYTTYTGRLGEESIPVSVMVDRADRAKCRGLSTLVSG